MKIALVLLLWGCSGGAKEKEKADEQEAPAPPLLLSPSGEHVLTQAMVPLVAWVPPEWRSSAVKVELDGRDITDPLGVLRSRWSRGGGADYIATLDLLGLEPGAHDLKLTFTDKEGEEGVLRARFQTDPAVRVDVKIVDEAGDLRPGRVLVLTGEGKRVNLWGPDAAAADPSDRDKAVPSLLAPQGQATMLLKPGTYRLIAAGGLRDGAAEQALTVEEGKPAALTFAVPRVMPAEGWLTADLHVHTAYSNDAFVAERVRYAALIAAGLDVAVITDHNLVSDRWKAGLASAGGGMSLVTGTEARIGKDRSLAHVIGFPLERGDKLPSRDLDPAAFLDAWRAAEGAGLLLQLNHPRGIQFFSSQKLVRTHDLLDKLEYTPWSPLGQQPAGLQPGAGGDPLAYDAMEIYNRFSWQSYKAVRQDWFSLMEMDGRFITGTGNSDSHSVEVEQVGIPVNFVRLPAPAPGALDPAAFADAIRAGRVSVSTGPFVEMSVRTAAGEGEPGGSLAAPGGAVEVTIRVQAAPWVPVDELRLVVNGQILAREDLAEPLGGQVDRGTWRFSLALDEDAWILAEAGWPLERPVEQLKGIYAALAPSYAPVGFTNPVRLDVDGDGAFTRRRPTVQRLAGPAPRAPAAPAAEPKRKGDTGEPPG